MQMIWRRIVLALAAVAGVCACAIAGERGPGKYSGVVIFDRWGGCTLYSGIYVMYVSEHAKEKLRAHAGRCVKIDATEVDQPRNPGDGLIKALTVLDTAPVTAREWESPAGLAVTVAPAFEDGRRPEVAIRVENVGNKPVTLRMDTFAPTLLAAKPLGARGRGPSDGPSTAVVTRESFWVDGPRMNGGSDAFRWAVIAPRRFANRVALEPKAVFELRLSFRLPPGQYEFLAGYGGGVHEDQCIASNLIAFDVKDDETARLARDVSR